MLRRTEPGDVPDLHGLWSIFSTIESATRAYLYTQRDLTDAERESEFARLSMDLRRAYVLRFLAATEGVVRLSYLAAHARRKTEPWRSWWHRFGGTEYVRLDEILDIWRSSTPAMRRDISPFAELLAARHWLAHGQTWTVRLGRDWDDPWEIWTVCSNIAKALKP